MITGNDISYAQGVIDWSTYKNNTNFVIIQSSYGNGYFDAQYGNNKAQVLQTNLPHGYYHFAYPDLNSAEDEAKWFLHAISAIKPLQDGEVLILDYERTCSDNVAWVKTFLDTVSQALGGYKPLLYTYQDMLTSNDFSSVANAGYGLWIAAPTNDPSNNSFVTGAFPFACMQQWGVQQVPGINGDVDANVFFGDVDTFKKYGFKSQVIPAPQTEPVNVAPQTGPVAPSQPAPQTIPTPETVPSVQEVTATSTEIPVPVQTSNGPAIVNISTTTPESASQGETITLPIPAVQTPTMKKSSLAWISNLIAYIKHVIWG